ncbi:MAG: hypothetical protein M9951_09100 [Burkholderiaceae bacterium]|jgi:uncharacterized protein|nr:hypothetical protein [Burkholderiaceae bacterium]MEB2319277.1 PP0621 family protein [Pseudomonadota bacterium]
MGKVVFWLAVLGALFLVARAVSLIQRRDAARRRDAEAAPRALEMDRCAHCGVHFPRADAVRSGDSVYCCEEHRRAASQ